MEDLKSMNSKINLLQTQVAMLSLTIASLQSHIKEMDKQLQELKQTSTVDCASVKDDSDGYDSDENFKPVNPYVLVQWDDDELEEL